MRLGLNIGYAGASLADRLPLVLEAERLGFDSLWAAEAYGCDAVSCATWLAAHTSRLKVGTAIMQIPARTPASAAMTTIGLNALSGGRFILGLGSSGPQVAEGWHGVNYDKPLTRTREYVDIIRRILAREEPLLNGRSDYVYKLFGVYAVAESAALCAARKLGGAGDSDPELVLPKVKTARATCAIARIGSDAGDCCR